MKSSCFKCDVCGGVIVDGFLVGGRLSVVVDSQEPQPFNQDKESDFCEDCFSDRFDRLSKKKDDNSVQDDE